ncbi:MAG: cation transporter [Bacteroidales bacterium]|nr:cation transporter [Bacteroidales bacterium]
MKSVGVNIDELSARDKEVVAEAHHVTWVGFWINAALGIGKVLAGIFGRSTAMVADGIHSFSDFITDLIVIVFVGVARRKADNRYQYGHGKYETFATLVVALILGGVGVLFFIDGIELIWKALHGEHLERPTILALVMAAVSIISKEWLYRYTRAIGERIGSAVVVANAWHHRSDALSSLATLLGISGAMFLGPQWRILDPLAAVVVSVLIVVVSFQIGKPAVRELLEVSLPEDTVTAMYAAIGATEGVKAFHRFASRRNGNRMILDFHIKVDPDITVSQGHHIASEVERSLKDKFGDEMMVNIHVEPYAGQPVDENKMCE